MGTRSDERTGFLGNIITGAVEGGTGYWAQVSQYQYTMGGELCVCVGRRDGDEACATFHEMEDDESGYKAEGVKVTLNMVAGAVRKITDGDIGVHSAMFYAITRANRDNDAGDIDADAADAIVQVAIFGKIVYG